MQNDVIKQGDRVSVVLEVVRTEKAGIPMQRVFMRGVYPYDDHARFPKPYDGAVRNEVGAFFGLDMGVASFLIETVPAGESPDILAAAAARLRGGWPDLAGSEDAEAIASAITEAVAPLIRARIAEEIRAQQQECEVDEHHYIPKPSCWTCGRNGAFERAARISAGTFEPSEASDDEHR